MPDPLDEPSVARLILHGDAELGWKQFDTAYRLRLRALAEQWHARLALQGSCDAEDLVQAFLEEKVLRQPALMLAPVVSGEKPLWPRLNRSFVNYCKDARRKVSRGVVLPAVGGEAVLDPPAPAPGELDVGSPESRIRALLGQRMQAMRNAFRESSPEQVPFLHLLLLSERLLLLRRVRTALELPGGGLPNGVVVTDLVEQLCGWAEAEEATKLPPKKRALGRVWQKLRPKLQDLGRCDHGNAVADALGAPRNTWHMWIRRARVRVIENLGPEACQALFPYWPERLFTPTTRHTVTEK